VNVHPALQSIITLFVREHTRRAWQLSALGNMNDEEMYQRSRTWVIALIQKITYTQYIPAILGKAISAYAGYDPEVVAGADTDFVGAAYRYGHSTISNAIRRVDNDAQTVPGGNILLRDHFFNIKAILDSNGDIEYIFRGLVVQADQKPDSILITIYESTLLTNHTILRRRELHNLAPPASFADLTSDPESQAQLASVYATVDDVDAWVGGLCEDHEEGETSHLGPLFTAIIVITRGKATNMIFAYGAGHSSLSSPHCAACRGGQSMDIFAALSGSAIASSSGLLVQLETQLVTFHGIIMAVIFLVAFPISLFHMRYLKTENSVEFHSKIMGCGIFIGEMTMLAMNFGLPSKIDMLHARLGLTMFVALLVSSFLGNYATKLGSFSKYIKKRFLRLGHRAFGAATLVVGYITASFGIIGIYD
jgi:Animal haem peroxidase